MDSPKYVTDHLAILAIIESVPLSGWPRTNLLKEVAEIRRLLNRYHKEHCVVVRSLFGVFHREVHSHGAKGCWADLNHKLEEILRDSRERQYYEKK